LLLARFIFVTLSQVHWQASKQASAKQHGLHRAQIGLAVEIQVLQVPLPVVLSVAVALLFTPKTPST
jgi:hypothetical protein